VRLLVLTAPAREDQIASDRRASQCLDLRSRSGGAQG
jgi:hypothetical protein